MKLFLFTALLLQVWQPTGVASAASRKVTNAVSKANASVASTTNPSSSAKAGTSRIPKPATSANENPSADYSTPNPTVAPTPALHKVYSFPFTGRIYTDQYFLTNSENSRTLAQSSASIWLDLDSHTDKGLGARFVGQFDFLYRDLNHRDESGVFYQLREAYVSYLGEGSDLRIGQQIIPWGKSDGINPTDYFTAKNYTLLNPDDEVKRMGAPALNWVFTPEAGTSPVTLQLVVQAYYPQTKFIIPESVIPPGLTVNRYPKPPTAFQTNSMEYGFKVSYLKPDYDLSFSVFHGFAQYPEYVFNLGSQAVDAINPEESALGTDASFTLTDFIVRLESAVHMPDNGKDTDPLYGLVEPWHWDSVIGIEKPVFDDFRVQLQLLYRWHLYYQDALYTSGPNAQVNQIQQGVARTNATLLNYRKQGNPGATFRIGYAKDSSKWTVDLFLVGYFAEGQDYLLRPQVGFTPSEGFKLLAGFDLYGGDPTGPLGALHHQSDGFFEAKYLF